MTKRLIVNADDFGLAEGINGGIIAAHREGILTSASLLANGPAFDQAVDLSRQFPDLSLGVHLNISQGPPISPETKASGLVNSSGVLHLSPFALWTGIAKRQIKLEDIQTEWRVQIARVFEAGIAPTHIDGHLHVHVLPQLSGVIVALAQEFSISCVRSPIEDLESTLPILWKLGGAGKAALKRSAIAMEVSLLAQGLRTQLRSAGLTTVDSFFGLAHTGFLDTQALKAILEALPSGVTELMCHPGYGGTQLRALGGDLTYQREAEVLALTAPEIREAINKLGIELVNFRRLQANPIG